MELMQVFGCVLLMLVLLSVLRQYNPGHAVLASLACGLVLLGMAASALTPVIAFVKTLSQLSNMEHLASVFKAVAISIGVQCVQDLCQEAGQTALAGRVELLGKVAVLTAAMPLFSQLVQTLMELLQ